MGIEENHHHHHHKVDISGGEVAAKNILLSIILNFAITAIQIVGGLFTGSLALIGDAMHNLADTFSLVMSYFAIKLAGKKKTEKKTFGYQRVEIIVALLNASILVVVSAFLFKEGVVRLFNPVVINGKWVIAIASFGLVANSACALLLKGHSHDNMNVRSAFIHLMLDALVSLAVIVGAVIIQYTGYLWIDSLLVFMIGLYVIKEGYSIVIDALKILMQYVPDNIDITEIKKELEKIEGIKNVHHVHVWGMTERDIHFEGHIEVNDTMTVAETCPIKEKIEKHLLEEYKITHTTLQFECGACENQNLVNN